jgi:hypothetical protein
MKPLPLLFLVAVAVFASASLRADPGMAGLLKQAEQEAPGELQLHIIKTHGRLSNFICKARTVEQVPGWRQIRVQGDAAYAAWDNLRRDDVWHGGKFEILYDIVNTDRLKLNSVTFAGETTKADP